MVRSVVAVAAVVSWQLPTVAGATTIGHVDTETSRSLRSHSHHHETTAPHHSRHKHHQPHASAAAPVDLTLSCEYEGQKLRNRQTLQLGGASGHKGSLYALCLDGKIVCHEELGIADTPALADLNCSRVAPRRRLGLVVESPQVQTWPQGVVCYTIAANFTAPQLAQIELAMAQVKNETKIRFLDVAGCSANVTVGGKAICGDCKNFVNVNNWDEGCYSAVGYQNAGPQAFNLHAACFDDLTGTGRVVHELGHTLGLYHEHSHPNRKVIVIPGELKVSRNNYQVFASAMKLNYDVASIMHYGSTAGLCIPKDASIKYCDVSQSPDQDQCVIPTRDACDAKASEVLGQRLKLSPVDLESIVKLYGNVKLTAADEDALDRASRNAIARKMNGQPNPTPPPPPPTQSKSSNSFFAFIAELTGWIS